MKKIISMLGMFFLTANAFAYEVNNGYVSSGARPIGNGPANNGYASSGARPIGNGPANNGYASSGARPSGYPANNGYYSSGARPSNTFVFNAPMSPPSYVVTGPTPQWINSREGMPLPYNAVIGGGQFNQSYYICRSDFNGGIHPGKWANGRCFISWGGNEIATNFFQILVSPRTLTWARAYNGFTPYNALPGGYEYNRTVYVCQANFRGVTIPGKVINNKCYVGWQGQEIILPDFSVLTA